MATKGKIVLVPFPFDDLSTMKARPAVCLTEPIGQYRHVVLAFVSSRVAGDLTDADMVIDSKDSDFGMTGLKVTSVIRLHPLMTVTASVIQRELGELSPRLSSELAGRLRRLFGLD